MIYFQNKFWIQIIQPFLRHFFSITDFKMNHSPNITWHIKRWCFPLTFQTGTQINKNQWGWKEQTSGISGYGAADMLISVHSFLELNFWGDCYSLQCIVLLQLLPAPPGNPLENVAIWFSNWVRWVDILKENVMTWKFFFFLYS